MDEEVDKLAKEDTNRAPSDQTVGFPFLWVKKSFEAEAPEQVGNLFRCFCPRFNE